MNIIGLHIHITLTHLRRRIQCNNQLTKKRMRRECMWLRMRIEKVTLELNPSESPQKTILHKNIFQHGFYLPRFRIITKLFEQFWNVIVNLPNCRIMN